MHLNAVCRGKLISVVKWNKTLTLVTNFIIGHWLGRVQFGGGSIYCPELLGTKIGCARKLKLADKESQQNNEVQIF